VEGPVDRSGTGLHPLFRCLPVCGMDQHTTELEPGSAHDFLPSGTVSWASPTTADDGSTGMAAGPAVSGI